MVLFLNIGEYWGNIEGMGTRNGGMGTRNEGMGVKKWGILCKIIKKEKYFLLLKLLRILKIIFLTIYAVVPKTIFT